MLRAPALLVALIAAAAATTVVGLCSREYCQCGRDAHPKWGIVNCTVPQNQRVDLVISKGDLLNNTTVLIISGAESVKFEANSLSQLEQPRQVQVHSTRHVVLRKFAAVNLKSSSMYLDVRGCSSLTVEERTFDNLQGPLTVNINDCQEVSLEKEAFSWLLQVNVTKVDDLQLASGAFRLQHAPSQNRTMMKIFLTNVKVKELSNWTFGSSADSITMESVEVEVVKDSVFTANTYYVVTARNCNFGQIYGGAFSQNTVITNLSFLGCRINQLAPGAIRSAIANLSITNTTIEAINPGAINITVAAVSITDNKFVTFEKNGLHLSSCTTLRMERNKINELGPNAIILQEGPISNITFIGNEIETSQEKSLAFLGEKTTIQYKNNYFDESCQCDIGSWLMKVLDTKPEDYFFKESYCTIPETFPKCYNLTENDVQTFLDEVCNKDSIQCQSHVSKDGEESTEIERINPRFPRKGKEKTLSARDKKVIGIVIVTAVGCILIVMVISFIRWMRRRGHCLNVKNFLISSNTACASVCDRLCSCRSNSGMDNAGSISQLAINEYSERHRLNEPRIQEIIHETTLPDMYTQDIEPMEDKATQTLPEELTKELLVSLKEKLDDPENYAEAREMIEHLYEIIKVQETCNNTPSAPIAEENIYDLPFQNTVPRLGRNKKQMISIGTRTPSLDKLTPLSPYNRQIALAHEYFEPKDLTVHLYAEITNLNKDKNNFLNSMPDVVAEQAAPRGPYLRAVRDKMNSSTATSPTFKTLSSFAAPKSPTSPSPPNVSTIKSNKSTSSNTSGKMVNRPLPEKPITFDPGEGTSPKQG